MTQMSEPRMPTPRTVEQLRVARPLHSSSVLRLSLALAMFTGCVIPPSLSADTTDAGANSAPAIVSVRADLVEFPQFTTLVFERGANAGSLNLTLHDTDLDDTLYVRIFVNYNNPDPEPPRSTCLAAGRTVERTATCTMNNVCRTVDVGADPLPLLQVFVFDRDYEADIPPAYMGMAPSGLSSSQTFFLRCQEPSI
jgi:hypothetical protein